MIKANALMPATSRNTNVPETLVKNCQNIIIECSKNKEFIPSAVEELAYRMLRLDSDLKGILKDLRILYGSKKEDFHLCLAGKTEEKKQAIITLFQDLYGVISEVHYCQDCQMLNGKLVFTPKAQLFIMGQYLEIAIAKAVQTVLDELSSKHEKVFKLHRNVKVATKDGHLKNEFDLVIENVSDSIVYVLEVKSGKNFRDFDKLARVGREYGIVPNRLLLIGNYLSEENMETIEYFCEYYVANLEQNSLERKLAVMLGNDL